MSKYYLFLFYYIFNLKFYNFLNFNLNSSTSAANFTENEFFSCVKKPIAVLILARGGSKGIPLKNLALLSGSSLLGRALHTIEKSNIFSNVWVSTDHDAIAAEAKIYNAKVHIRPSNVSLDDTPSIVSVQEFLMKHDEIENIALVQCTSVFLKAKYLNEANELFQTSDCVFAALRSHKLRWRFDTLNQKYIPLNFNPLKRPRRQDWRGELIETGMFYFTSRELILNGSFQNDRCKIAEIDQRHSLEIDYKEDLKLAEILIDLYDL